MNITEILGTMLNGEPLHDSIVIGWYGIIGLLFYEILFSAMLSIFKR